MSFYVILKQNTFGSNLEVSFSKTKNKEYSLPFYLPKAGERRDGFMPFSLRIRVKWNNLIQDENSAS